jgi:MBOAT, membrane-bound O-acyltransferase family
MQTVAGFLAPYLVALLAFPLLLRQTPLAATSWLMPFVICVLIVCAPGLIPADSRMLRFLASMSAAMVAMKVIDVAIDLRQRRVPTWPEYRDFLANPFTLVRRCLADEPRLARRENLLNLAQGLVGCAAGVALLIVLFRVDWSAWGFLVEHVGKVFALMLAIVGGLLAAAALWRLCGGAARDFMDRPFAATTPADFWRRYNRNVQQFFWQVVFKNQGGRRSPIRTTLLVFALSALLHELIFFAAVGRVQGYQTAFFALQGIAAAWTVRVKVKGWRAVPWMSATLVFNLVSSVLFFASIHSVVPFYAQELPQCLRGW